MNFFYTDSGLFRETFPHQMRWLLLKLVYRIGYELAGAELSSRVAGNSAHILAFVPVLDMQSYPDGPGRSCLRIMVWLRSFSTFQIDLEGPCVQP
jgi:hypothetical protein